MKLALLERECDGGADELPTPTLDDAIAKNPTSNVLYDVGAGLRASAQDRSGGWVVAAAVVLSRPSSRQGVAAGRARGSYQAGLRRCSHSLALWQLAGALETRGAHRSSGSCCLVLLPPVCLTDGTWHMAAKYTDQLLVTSFNMTPTARVGTADRKMTISLALLTYSPTTRGILMTSRQEVLREAAALGAIFRMGRYTRCVPRMGSGGP